MWVGLDIEPDVGYGWYEDEWSICEMEGLGEEEVPNRGNEEVFDEKGIVGGWMGERRDFWI